MHCVLVHRMSRQLEPGLILLDGRDKSDELCKIYLPEQIKLTKCVKNIYRNVHEISEMVYYMEYVKFTTVWQVN